MGQRSPFSLLKWRFLGPWSPPFSDTGNLVVVPLPVPIEKAMAGEKDYTKMKAGTRALGLGKNIHISWRWSVDLGAFHRHFWLPKNRNPKLTWMIWGYLYFRKPPYFFAWSKWNFHFCVSAWHVSACSLFFTGLGSFWAIERRETNKPCRSQFWSKSIFDIDRIQFLRVFNDLTQKGIWKAADLSLVLDLLTTRGDLRAPFWKLFYMILAISPLFRMFELCEPHDLRVKPSACRRF